MTFCNDHEEKLIETLKAYRYLHNRALSSQELAAILRVDPRKVRAMVAHLRADHKQPICSTAQEGFWYACSRDDADHTIKQLYSRRRELEAAINGILDGLDAEFGEPSLFDERMAV